MAEEFTAGRQALVIESDYLAPHQQPEDMAKLVGHTGLVTGRTYGRLVEVRILGDSFGYLMHPSQLELLAEEPMPEGQLCDRLKNYEVHESYSATRGPRGGRCDRKAKAKDGNGTWACGIHLGADKRGEEARKRGQQRRAWRNSSEGRAFMREYKERGL